MDRFLWESLQYAKIHLDLPVWTYNTSLLQIWRNSSKKNLLGSNGLIRSPWCSNPHLCKTWDDRTGVKPIIIFIINLPTRILLNYSLKFASFAVKYLTDRALETNCFKDLGKMYWSIESFYIFSPLNFSLFATLSIIRYLQNNKVIYSTYLLIFKLTVNYPWLITFK
jgi:hypothetical protein